MMMRKLFSFFAVLFMLFLSINAEAQSKAGAEYFAGSWTILIKGTPNGDVKLVLALDKKTDSLTGIVQDTTGNEVSKISSIELKDNEITVFFSTQGYDVNVNLVKKDDDHANGTLMNMFEVEGVRKKEAKK